MNEQLQENETALNEPHNMIICPNCMEPNTDDLANCRYCGCPLHPEDEYVQRDAPITVPEVQAETEPEMTPEEKKAEKEAQRKKSRSNVLKYLGVYVIFLGADQLFTVLNGDGPDKKLGIISSIIYIVAGIMLALPLFGDLKRRLFPKRPENENIEETQIEVSLDPELVKSDENGNILTGDSMETDDLSEKNEDENGIKETE